MTTLTLPQNAAAPFAIPFTISPVPASLDLTTITAVTWVVTRPDLTVVTWTATILAGGTASSITTSYTVASGGTDLAQTGLYRVAVHDAVSGGEIPGACFNLFVVPANKWLLRELGVFPLACRAPYGVSFQVMPSPASFDLRTISAISWTVTRPGGAVVTWVPTIAGGTTAALLTANYTFASDGSDIPLIGTYLVAVNNAVPGGTLPGSAFSFVVVPANAWTGS